MKHIIEGLSITAKKDKFCLFSAIQDILANNDIILSDSDIFVLCNGLNLCYESDLNFIGYGGLDEIVLNLSKGNLLKVNLCYKMGSNEEMFNKSIEPILGDKPVLLFVGTGGLCYTDAFKQVSNENRGHSIILYGVDEDTDSVYIGDAYYRDSSGQMLKYMGIATIKEIKDSIFGFAWFEFDKEKTKIDKKTILERATGNFEEFLKGRVEGEKSYGNTALNRFISDIEKLDTLNDSEFVQTCINVHFNIKIRSIIIIFDFLISFIEDNNEFQTEGCNILIEKLKFVRKEWEKVGLNILKAGRTKRKAMIHDIIFLCNENVEKQEGIFKEYLAYLQRLDPE
jgi:hypothetical protein